jgi:hypothetical protein
MRLFERATVNHEESPKAGAAVGRERVDTQVNLVRLRSNTVLVRNIMG